MPLITLRGVPVEFPFEPYELQKNYMEKVIECLQNETHGVLESPTGTGKTLSLLCSSLGWLSIKKAQVQAQRVNAFGDGGNFANIQEELGQKAGASSTGMFFGTPTIIYSSRTHSQLSQAMQELKNSSYSGVKASVLGSRDMMCIHPDVLKEDTTSNKIHMCRMKLQTNSCHFYNRLERKKEDPHIQQQTVVDIEDLVKLGKKHGCCPYYLAKEMKQKSDIVFMPYNYLLDPRVRKALSIELSNNIIIFDEAHNIERICEDSASLQIRSTDITLAIEEVTEVMKAMSEESASFFSADTPKDFTAEELCILKEMLLEFEKAIDSIKVNNEKEGQTYEGNYIFQLLAEARITDGNYSITLNLIEKILQFLSMPREGLFQRKGNGLQVFEDLLRVVFTSTTSDYKSKVNRCYKVHVVIEEQKTKTVNTWLSKASTAKKGAKVVNYWCFSPGFGMNMMTALGVRCVILTSGTLAPLKPLISELELNVKVFLENPHIVTQEQICVKVISKGPDNEPLYCTYQNRDNRKFITSLGATILNITRHVPEGLLIFFPSYPVLQKCQEVWQETELWSSINQRKQIYIEPKQKDAFTNVMNEYYAKIRDPNMKGAIFMAVCRGKVSEGLDFADMNGRAVIIIGLPYPPLRDPRVILKKKYLDVCNSTNKEYLRGDDWYNLEASRAVNQAIGRVIRHRYDYGAIIFLDSRYESVRIKNQLSMWLRNYIKVVQNFGEVVRDLRNFFKNAEAKFPVKVKPLKIESEEEVSKSVGVELEPTNIYKRGFKDSISSTSTNSSSDSSGLVTIHKRTISENLANKSKKFKLNIVPNPSKKAKTETDIKEYLATVRKELQKDDFQAFVKAMGSYRDSGDFAKLSRDLDGLFLDRNQQARYIIDGLSPYIKDTHKNNFENYSLHMK